MISQNGSLPMFFSRPNFPALFEKKGVLLLASDEEFRNLFEGICSRLRIPTTSYRSLDEMNSVARLQDYDFAVFDSMVGVLNGVEVAEYVDALFPQLPVILLGLERPLKEKLPKSIKKIISKAVEPYEIIKSIVLELVSHRFRCPL